MSKLSGLTRTLPTAVSWAIACDLRRSLERISCLKWPRDGLTHEEERRVSRILDHIEAARREVLLLQGSLAERSKLSGMESPAYAIAREWNG